MEYFKSKTFLTDDQEQTRILGSKLGKKITAGCCIALEGGLGAGKTTFVQGVAKGLKIDKKYYITSPTFNIINQYPAGRLTLCHIDLYRLASIEELEYTGFEDLNIPDNILMIEWPEILEEINFQFDIKIRFDFDENYNRILSFFTPGPQISDLTDNLIL